MDQIKVLSTPGPLCARTGRQTSIRLVWVILYVRCVTGFGQAEAWSRRGVHEVSGQAPRPQHTGQQCPVLPGLPPGSVYRA